MNKEKVNITCESEDFCEYFQSGYHFDTDFYKTIVSATECY